MPDEFNSIKSFIFDDEVQKLFENINNSTFAHRFQ